MGQWQPEEGIFGATANWGHPRCELTGGKVMSGKVMGATWCLSMNAGMLSQSCMQAQSIEAKSVGLIERHGAPLKLPQMLHPAGQWHARAVMGRLTMVHCGEAAGVLRWGGASLTACLDELEGGFVDGCMVRLAAPRARVHATDVAVGRIHRRAALPAVCIELGSERDASTSGAHRDLDRGQPLRVDAGVEVARQFVCTGARGQSNGRERLTAALGTHGPNLATPFRLEGCGLKPVCSPPG